MRKFSRQRCLDPDPVCPERLDPDPDPFCPERLDPDPVNIRPDPQPWTPSYTVRYDIRIFAVRGKALHLKRLKSFIAL